jgi:hypothetical protein
LRAGFIEERPHQGRFVIERSFSLDPSHACYRELRALLRAACDAVGLLFNSAPRQAHSGRKMGWPPDHRGRASLALALSRNEPSDVGMLAKACGANRRQILDRIRLLEVSRCVSSFMLGRSVWVKFNDQAPIAGELRALLDAMWQSGLRYGAMRVMGDASGRQPPAQGPLVE